ncbi:unnamed protein product [Colias eurytheme]|nr:unnamed protein product [Colias eurytheme]
MRVWWFAIVLCVCSLELGSDALPPAALGDVVINAASSLNSMKGKAISGLPSTDSRHMVIGINMGNEIICSIL